MSANPPDLRRKPVPRLIPQPAPDPTEPEDPLTPGHPLIANFDLEGTILSALLCDHEDGRVWRLLAPSLRAEHFCAHANQRVYEAIAALRGGDPSKPAGAVFVAQYMREHGTLFVGGAAYIAETLALCQLACARPELLVGELVELWRRRELLAAMQRAAIELRGGMGFAEAVKGLREVVRTVR